MVWWCCQRVEINLSRRCYCCCCCCYSSFGRCCFLVPCRDCHCCCLIPSLSRLARSRSSACVPARHCSHRQTHRQTNCCSCPAQIPPTRSVAGIGPHHLALPSRPIARARGARQSVMRRSSTAPTRRTRGPGATAGADACATQVPRAARSAPSPRHSCASAHCASPAEIARRQKRNQIQHSLTAIQSIMYQCGRFLECAHDLLRDGE